MQHTRQTRRLAAATGVAAVGLAAGGTAGPLLAAEFAGEQAAGWPITALTAGAAISALLMAAIGSRRDRVLALRAGHAVAVVGAAIAVLAAATASFALLLLGTVALGAGNTAIFLTRYTAAASAAPGHFARAMSAVLTATALGATASPLLLGPAATLASAMRLPGPAGLYLLAMVTYALAAALLRQPQAPPAALKPRPMRSALKDIDRRGAISAVGVLAAANLLMVGVMSVAPVHLVHHGTSTTAVGIIVAAHVAAMFGPSPLTSRLADRAGPAPTALLGMAVLTMAGTASVLIDATDPAHTTLGLLLLGLGWNLSLVGGSAILTTAAPIDARPHLEAIGEIAMGTSAAVSAPLAGLAVSTGLTTVWLGEAAAAVLAATLFAGYVAIRPRARA